MKGELELLARIRQRLGDDGRDVLVGIGDDAAVLAPSSDSSVLTVDVAVDGVHFRRELASWHDIGRRAFVAAVSDLAAMGASPRAALLSLILPGDLDDDAVVELVEGVGAASREHGCPVVGGNLSSGAQLSITTTAVGGVDGEPLRRDGAREGDGIYVSGTIGDAGLGLALLERGRGDEEDDDVQRFVERWRRPSAALQLGRRLRGQATAAIDLSDGVLQDLGHVCEASGVGAEIDATLLPLAPGFARLCTELGLDPLEVALGSGDDYRLLFTGPASALSKGLGTRIGRITAERGEARVLDAEGRAVEIRRRGWQHFS